MAQRAVVFACFFISGFTALIYEIAWLQRVQLVLGHTIYSQSTALAAFLTGLGLGALFSLRLIRMGVKALRFYLYAELAIGIYALAFYPALNLLHPLLGSLMAESSLAVMTAAQFTLCFLWVLFPTFLMGTTLPLLVHHLTRRDPDYKANVFALYLMNTLGGALGCALAGLLLLPELGYRKTMLLGAGLNFALFFLGARMSRTPIRFSFSDLSRFWAGLRSEHRSAGSPRAPSPGLLGILFISGFFSLLAQIVWKRLGSLVIGPSVYVLPLVTTIALLGIVLGSWLAKRRMASHEGGRALAVSAMLAGLAFHGGNFLAGKAPIAVAYFYAQSPAGFYDLILLEFLLLSVCFLPSATALGALFPLALTELGAESLALGYAVNIAGLLSGAVLGSNVLLPWIGLQNLSLLSAAALVISGLLFVLARSRTRSRAMGLAALGAVSLLIAAFSLDLDKELLTSGAFYNRVALTKAPEQLKWGIEDYLTQARKDLILPLLDYSDDPHATISIHTNGELESKEVRTFRINGKSDGSTTLGDQTTTRLLSWFGLLGNPNPHEILNIGLGLGLTAALPAKWYPELRKEVIVELSPSIAAYARKYFYDFNYQIWNDPRVELRIRDGREFLQHTEETFDLVISEPSNPWMEGVASLFTQDFLQSLAPRIKPGGWALLWFHLYGVDQESVFRVLNTVKSVFKTVYVFQAFGDIYILGNPSEEQALLHALPENLKDIEREFFILLGFDPTQPRYENYKLLTEKNLIFAPNELEQIDEVHGINTDDNQALQFETGRSFWRKNTTGGSFRLRTKEPRPLERIFKRFD